MRFLIVDLKRGLCERGFYYSVMLSLLCIIISFVITITSNNYNNLFISVHSMILPFVAPLLASLPYSNMNMIESETKFEILMFIRENNKICGKSFELRRFIVNGILSGLALVVPLFILLCVCFFVGLSTELSEILKVLLLDFIFGFAFGSLAYGLTFVNTKKYIPVIAPQVIYMLLIYAFPYLNLQSYYPPLCFSPWILPMYANYKNIIILLMIIIGISLGLTLFGKFKVKIHSAILGGR